MKIKVINSFFDRKNEFTLREVGQELELPEDRAEQLIGLGLVLPAEEKQETQDFPMNQPEEPAEEEIPAEKPSKKPGTRKKTKKNEEA